jgi:manganese efflux pump family protein
MESGSRWVFVVIGIQAIHHAFSLLLVAIALGMDAMSLGFGVGMKGLSKSEIARMSLTIGIFHVIMPLLGMFLGLYLHQKIGDVTRIFGAVLLLFFGGQMIYQSFKYGHEQAMAKTSGFGLLLFAMSVSIDALSVGFSLGLFEINPAMSVTLFGLVGALMAAIGLSIGSRMNRLLGNVSEIVGGLILIVFAVRFLV